MPTTASWLPPQTPSDFVKLSLFLTAAFALTGINTQAGLVSATSATTNMGSGFATSLNNSINGVGLSSLSLSATHLATIPNNSWVSSGTLTGNITFGFAAPFALDGFSFWNQNNGGPGALGSTGIRDLLISYSLDNVNFAPIPGAPAVFAQAPAGISPAQQFSFAPLFASSVRFSVQSNYGDLAQTGFAEVKFSGSAVPEPGTVIFGLALCGVAATRRRS